MRRGFGPFAAGLADGFAGGASDDVARRTGENGFAADLPADDRRTQDPLRRVGDVRAQDALAERNCRIPTARWQARHLGCSDEGVAVIAREFDFGSHFGVFTGYSQSFAFGNGGAVDRVDDDFDAVRVAHWRRAGEDARVVLLGVEDAQSIL